jgi:predicted permease
MLSKDLQHAFRSLARRPAFTGLVVAVLALCIGGSALMLSAVNALGINPLPYEDAEDLVVLQETYLPSGGVAYSPSYRNAQDWNEQNQVFEGMAPFMHYRYRVMFTGGAAERLRVNYTEADYFRLLGVETAQGRTWTEEEDRQGAAVALISHRLWRDRFREAEDILEQSISLDGGTYAIIGVLPEDYVDIPLSFEDHSPHQPVDLWMPLTTTSEIFGSGVLEDRMSKAMGGVLARLEPGIGLEASREEMDRIATVIGQEFAVNEEYGALVHSLKYYVFGNLDRTLNLLFAGSLFVLLIGCINVGSLILVRAHNRHRELALRSALGASRRQLMRQVLLEGLMLALAGGVLGCLLAVWGAQVMPAALALPPLVTIEIDLLVLAALAALTLLTSLVVTLPAALRVGGLELMDSLRPAGGREQGSSALGRSLRPLLVVEIATAVVLLVAAGLLWKSFQTLHERGMNYDSENLTAMRLQLVGDELASWDNVFARYRQLVEGARNLPAAEDALLWSPGIPGINGTIIEVYPEGQAPEDGRLQADLHFVSPDALAGLGIPLIKGREINSGDDSQAARAAVVSDGFAEHMWPGQEAIGKRFRSRVEAPWTTVVGVYPQEALAYRLSGNHNPTVLLSMAQLGPENFALLVRSSAPPGEVARQLREMVKGLSPSIPTFDIATIEQRLREEEEEERFSTTLMGLYAGLALVLTILGVYGTLSYSVARRTHELGIRRALGAQKGQLFQLVFGNAAVMLVMGLGLGLFAAWVLARVLSDLLEGVLHFDLTTYFLVSFVIATVVLVASYFPARRAIQVDPLIALKEE